MSINCQSVCQDVDLYEYTDAGCVSCLLAICVALSGRPAELTLNIQEGALSCTKYKPLFDSDLCN